jgi:membrane associated rhomboid family serine protease
VFRFPPLTPVARALLIALVVSFVLCAVLENFVGVPVVMLLALLPTVSLLTPLQVFTHLLVLPPSSDGLIMLLLSSLFLWLCLVPVEAAWGPKRAIQLILAAAVGSAAAALLFGLILPSFGGLVLGPGAITLAAIAGYVASVPRNAMISFGSVGMPARNLLLTNVAISVMYFLVNKNGSALVADLGALGTGLLFTRFLVMAPQRAPSRKRTSSSRLRLVKNEKDDDDDDEPKHWLN